MRGAFFVLFLFFLVIESTLSGHLSLLEIKKTQKKPSSAYNKEENQFLQATTPPPPVNCPELYYTRPVSAIHSTETVHVLTPAL